MKNLSTTAVALITATVMLLFFSTVSYAFTPIDNSFDTAPAFGFTPTATASSGGTTSGGGPPSIPEPTTIILTGLGMAGLAGYAHRRRKNNDSSNE
jgi:hypothetical protein